MYQYVVLPEAYQEFFEAWEWYEAIQERLGDRFRNEVFRTIHQIVHNPYQYAERKPPYREALVEVFPYLIVYELFPEKKKIAIVSIFHCKRNPISKYRQLFRGHF